MPPWTTQQLASHRDYVAPDGSEIRLLPRVDGGSTCMCDLPAGAVTAAVRHKTIDEIWYVVGGDGKLWRKQGDTDEVVALVPGASVTIPRGTSFQFRNDGPATLQILIVTLPPWPGSDESEYVDGRWSTQPSVTRSPSHDAIGSLRRLNESIGEAERVGDSRRLTELLADTLTFRRADGSVVDKPTFLRDLERRSYSELANSDVRIAMFETLAVVTLVVTAAGAVDDKPFSGRYRNVRIFERSGNEWLLVRWYNHLIAAGAPPSPQATYERVLGVPFKGELIGLRWNTLEYLYGQIWNRGVLTDRDRRLITLALLAAQGHEKQLALHVHGARASGMSSDELLEIMNHVAHYAGWPAGTAGQQAVVAEIEREPPIDACDR